MFDAPWLDAAFQRFDARLARGQAPQALLIHGPAGIGRRHFGQAVAARLLGSDWRPNLATPADELAGVPHPDYWHVRPVDDSSVIKIDQIRDLNQALFLTSHQSGWKVALIWPAEAMNHNAANALLKTLEEPPPALTMVLITAAMSQLPATVVSRCERVRLGPPTREAALAWLVRRHPDRVACERALAFTAGAPLAAMGLLGDGVAARLLADLGTEVQQLIDRSVPPTTLARTWARRDAEVCLRWLYLQTAELLRRQGHTRGDPEGALVPLKIPEGPLNMTACCSYLDQLMEAQRLRDRALNMEAMFADLLMWWYGAAGAAR